MTNKTLLFLAPKPKQQAASTEADPSDIAAAVRPITCRNPAIMKKKAAQNQPMTVKVRGDDDDHCSQREVAGDPGV